MLIQSQFHRKLFTSFIFNIEKANSLINKNIKIPIDIWHVKFAIVTVFWLIFWFRSVYFNQKIICLLFIDLRKDSCSGAIARNDEVSLLIKPINFHLNHVLTIWKKVTGNPHFSVRFLFGIDEDKLPIVLPFSNDEPSRTVLVRLIFRIVAFALL